MVLLGSRDGMTVGLTTRCAVDLRQPGYQYVDDSESGAPELVAGDIVVASRLLSGETCADPRGNPQSDAVVEPAWESLREALRRAGLPARVGPILSVDHLVRGVERAQLWQGGALAVDMESAWLAAGAAGRPFAVLRVVLDGPAHELLHPATVTRALRALRRLREAAPALERWAAGTEAAAASASDTQGPAPLPHHD